MSELRHRYDRAAVSDRIIQPPFAELAARGRRRALRTRTARVAGVAGVAVLAALAASPLLTLPGEHPPGTPAAPLPPTSEPPWGPLDIGVEFFNLDLGVAHYRDMDDACGPGWFSVTRDGGTTWSELRQPPTVPGQDRFEEIPGESICSRASVHAIAPDTLVAYAPSVRPDPLVPTVRADLPSFISHDAGRTWQEYEPKVRTADSIPDGVAVGWDCEGEQCPARRLMWYDPRTGDRMVLRNNPPVGDGLEVAFDGSIWAYNRGPDGVVVQLSVSQDRGRSWLDRSPDMDSDWLDFALLTAYDGDTAYLHRALATPEPDPFDLYRTTDGGETWHQLPAAQRFEDVADVWMTGEGGLVVEDMTDQYLSTDGGETFARSELPVFGVSGLPGGGFQGYALDHTAADPVDFYLSGDGMTWHPVEVPYYPAPDDAPAATWSPAPSLSPAVPRSPDR